MKIVFFGTPHFVIPVLDALQKNYDVVGVVTAPDSVTGRKRTLAPSPIKQYCINTLTHVPVFTSKQFNNLAIEQLDNICPDLFVIAAYGHLVPKNVLNLPKYGALNIHPSLLPKYRGPSPIQAAILHGDTETGVTIIKMDEEIDHGPIIAQWKFPLGNHDTFENLHTLLFQSAAKHLQRIISSYIKREITPIPQNHARASFCGKVMKEDGFFDIDNPPSPEKLDRMIRAYYPWPTAYSKLKMKSFDNAPFSKIQRRQDKGEKLKIIKFLPEKKVQLEGGRPMSMKDFINGYPEARPLLERLFQPRADRPLDDVS
ncbi:MAG: methionyl-tRNA formyltransferase [Candidatus Levybacteria bacterium]|nr:methionyl-tRNA formyltransferase [Candidatus Levybacteria bacterium]